MRCFLIGLCILSVTACKPKKKDKPADNPNTASAPDTLDSSLGSSWTGMQDQIDPASWQVKDLP